MAKKSSGKRGRPTSATSKVKEPYVPTGGKRGRPSSGITAAKAQYKLDNPTVSESKRSFKGRSKGTGSSLFIEDTLIEPYYVLADSNQFILHKRGENTNKPLGYYTSLSSCLSRVMRLLALKGTSKMTLSQLVQSYDKVQVTLQSVIDSKMATLTSK